GRTRTLRVSQKFGNCDRGRNRPERRPFTAPARHAFDYVKLSQENRDLRETSAMTPEISRKGEATQQPIDVTRTFPLLRFPRVLRRLDNIEVLVTTVVEALADASGVSRVGLFSRTRKGDPYQLRAGLHCLPETEELQFGERDALVRWFESHSHLISR